MVYQRLPPAATFPAAPEPRTLMLLAGHGGRRSDCFRMAGKNVSSQADLPSSGCLHGNAAGGNVCRTAVANSSYGFLRAVVPDRSIHPSPSSIASIRAT